MGMRLVYIGATAELAPAASLRALAGSGAVFVPAGLEAPLRELIAAAVGSAGERGVAASAVSPPPAAPAPAGAPSPVTAPPASVEDRLVEATPAELDLVFERLPAVVCVAGEGGPALARAVLERARHEDVAVATVPVEPQFSDRLAGDQLVSLKRIIAILRTQCPWDREQTAGDIIKYTVEEVYELADAVAADDLPAEHGELGDVLLQVYLLALMLDERAAGDLGSVAAAIEVKLIRRHAHIFGDAVADTSDEVRGQWERIKREQEGREGIFHDVPASLPALLLARKLQERAAAVGFDWQSAAEAFPKIAEEQAELAEVLLGAADSAVAAPVEPGSGPASAPAPAAADRHDPRLRHEVGDLLFAVVNVARLARVDPELALRAAAQRFERRVSAAAAIAAAEGHAWPELGLAAQEAYYQRAKSAQSSPVRRSLPGAPDEEGT
jgi:MazG family protein